MTEQQFPLVENGAVRLKKWVLDIDAAAKASKLTQDRLTSEAAAMARAFPRWILTLVQDREPVRCKHCRQHVVFDRGLRCVACEKEAPATGTLGWFGLMPPIGIQSLERLRGPLLEKAPKRHVVGTQPGIGPFILVPLVATYPSDYPARPPSVRYLPEFRTIPGVPQEEISHRFHMLSGDQMCLYAPGEWQHDGTCSEVLQQRAYAHVVKFLNYANGKHTAFDVVTA